MNRQQYAALFQTLQRTRTRYAECVKVTRTDGVIYRFTAHDRELRISEPNNGGTHTYTPANAFSLSNLETMAGLAVSNMDIDAILDDDSITESDLQNGLFDNAQVELFLAYWANTKVAVLPLRISWVGEIQMSELAFKADLRGIAQRMAQVTTTLTTLECRHSFCDQNEVGVSKCLLNPADYTASFVVQEVIQNDLIRLNIPAAEYEGVYQYGKLTFTSGANNGLSMEVFRQWGERVNLFLPMKQPIVEGDTVTMLQGCNQTLARCKEFGNVINFGGEPFLAGGDMLTRVPAPGDPSTKGD